jgi:hypothetical protein
VQKNNSGVKICDFVRDTAVIIQAKLFLSSPAERHNMGGMEVKIQAFLILILMQVVQLHTLVGLPPRKNPGIHWTEGCVNSRANLEVVWRRNPLLGFESMSP